MVKHVTKIMLAAILLLCAIPGASAETGLPDREKQLLRDIKKLNKEQHQFFEEMLIICKEAITEADVELASKKHNQCKHMANQWEVRHATEDISKLNTEIKLIPPQIWVAVFAKRSNQFIDKMKQYNRRQRNTSERNWLQRTKKENKVLRSTEKDTVGPLIKLNRKARSDE